MKRYESLRSGILLLAFGIALIGSLLAAGWARADSPAIQATPAPVFATFTFADGQPVRVFATDPQTVRDLTAIAAGQKKDMIPNGLLLDDRPGRSPYDPRWSFHFRPESLQMAEVTIEVCDGTPSYIQDHMDEWFAGAKEARWCSWSAHLTKLEPLVYGDVTGDGQISLADAQSLLRIVIGVTAPNEAQRIAGDIYPAAVTDGPTGDGQIDLRDVVALLRRAVGIA